MTRLTRRTAPIVAVTLMLALVPGLQQARAVGFAEVSAWQPRVEAPIREPKLVRSYLQPTSDYSAGHRGVDYRVSLGEEVLAPADGTVWFSGKVVNREMITIKTTDGRALLEVEPVCDAPAAGTSVLVGQPIGEVCDADQSYRQHCADLRCLHFSYRIESGYLSPIWVMGQLSPSRLLPWTDV
jgi:hypothetical protein